MGVCCFCWFLFLPGRMPRDKDTPRPPAGCPARGADAPGPQKKVFWFLFFRYLAGGRVIKIHPVPRLVALPEEQMLPVHRKSLLVPFLPIPAGGRVVKMHPVPRLVALPEGQTLPVHRKSLLVPFLQKRNRKGTYSANILVDRYRSPVSGRRVTMVLPLFSGRRASWMAAQTAAPAEMPARTPSSRPSRRPAA